MHRAIIPLASGTPVSEATDGNGIVAKCTKGPERCSEPFGIGIDQPILRAGRFIVVVVRRDDDAANDGNESEASDDPVRAAFRSEERRVGKGWGRTCRCRWSAD